MNYASVLSQAASLKAPSHYVRRGLSVSASTHYMQSVPLTTSVVVSVSVTGTSVFSLTTSASCITGSRLSSSDSVVVEVTAAASSRLCISFSSLFNRSLSCSFSTTSSYTHHNSRVEFNMLRGIVVNALALGPRGPGFTS